MKKRKIFMAVVACALAVFMLAGCGGGNGGIQPNEAVKSLPGYQASAEPLTLTIHMHFWSTYVFDDNWPIYKKAAEYTNISLHGTASNASTESEQLFNTMLTSNPLPDIIHGDTKYLNKAGADGAMIPLQDLINEYAPHIKAALDENPDIMAQAAAADGNLYCLPNIQDPSGPAMGWFIRQDWLDKLGLPVPTTVDELYNTLKAFREQDPNGNGKKDEVPYFDRHQGVTKLVPLWNTNDSDYSAYSTYSINGKGEVFCTAATEGYKTAMKELAKWYAEGLIDQELFTRTNSRETLFGDNVGGMVTDWFASTSSFNDKLADSVPGFNLAAIAPVKNVNGELRNEFSRGLVSTVGWGISKDNKYPAETIKYFDFFFTDEGRRLCNAGVEGDHYYYDENGEFHFTDEVMNYDGGAPTYLRTIGSQEIGRLVDLEVEIAGMVGDAKDAFKKYSDNKWTVKAFPQFALTDEEQRTIANKGTALDTHIIEMQTKWIMGNADVDATWDAYIADLKSLGLDEVVGVYQAAYDRTK